MLRGVETSVDEGVEKLVFDKYRHRGGVEEQTIKYKNRSSINPPAIEKLSREIERIESKIARCVFIGNS